MWTLDPIGQFVQLLSRVVRASWDNDAKNGFGIVEYAKAFALRNGSEVNEFHSESNVWLVTSIAFHCFVVCHPWERLDFHIQDHLEQMAHHVFERLQHVFLLYESHFAVDLCEFRLTICAQIFISETLDDLIVAVVSAYHQ